MKKYLFAFIVLTLFLVACEKQAEVTTPGQQDTETQPAPEKVDNAGKLSDMFKGFMAYKAGSWAEWESQSADQKVVTKMEILSYNGGVLRMQTSGNTGENEFVSQMWINTNENDKASKYVMKSGGQVLCMNIDTAPKMDLPDTKNYEDTTKIIGSGTYTTLSGKSVSVMKFKDSETQGESWVSSDVPFGMAKIIDGDGKIEMSLKDFGTSGAVSKITDAEIANCQDLSAMLKQAEGAKTQLPSDACSYCNQLTGEYKQQCLASC